MPVPIIRFTFIIMAAEMKKADVFPAEGRRILTIPHHPRRTKGQPHEKAKVT